MPSTKSLSVCFYAASAAIALVLAVASGAWVLGGPLGLVLGMAVGFIPAMLIVVLGFPVTAPALLLAAYWLERKSARKLA